MKWFLIIVSLFMSNVFFDIYNYNFLQATISLVALCFAWASGVLFIGGKE